MDADESKLRLVVSGVAGLGAAWYLYKAFQWEPTGEAYAATESDIERR